MTTPRAIARLELHKDFTLEAALPLVEHFAELGISHLCASPLLTARADIPAGLGVTDHTAIDPALGGEAALRRLVSALRRHHMGLIVEITPGHMATGGADNAAWNDLLEWGRDSTYASWFNVDWHAADGQLRHKLLTPFLDRPYGMALAEGAITLAFETATGRFVVRHRHHAFPICPLDYPRILEAGTQPVATEMAGAFASLSRIRLKGERLRAAHTQLHERASTGEGRTAINTALSAFNRRDENGRTRLHTLLERQSYRLAHTSMGRDENNWRSHPDHPELIGLRVERHDVFDATHTHLLDLYAEGLVDGFRIAGWNDLADPAAYASRLRLKLSGRTSQRPEGLSAAYLVAAAALRPGAPLPHGGELAGTTGAEAQEAISAVLHDALSTATLTDIWMGLTGDRLRYDDKYLQTRRDIVTRQFEADLHATTRTLQDVAEADLTTRDFSFPALRRVTLELALAFRVPRTCADMNGLGEWDARQFSEALGRARRRLQPQDLPVLEQVADWLASPPSSAFGDIEQNGARASALARFEQFTAAIHQVAVDEALSFRHGRLLSRSEAGADPTLLGLRAPGFHERMAERAVRSPHAITATSGRTRRLGEDARARLAVVSETPREWETLLQTLQQIMAPFRTRLLDGVAPEPADEILLYQALVASWPPAVRLDDALALGALHDRVTQWLRLVIRSAGVRTSHLLPNADYEEGCARFLSTLMEGEAGAPARKLLHAFVGRIARAGTLNALSQCVLKHTVPGVPELYQGGSLWDYRLETTDRAPTPALLSTGRPPALPAALPNALLDSWPDGRVKQAVTARLLALRARHPALFAQGRYEPLMMEGRQQDRALAFMRRHRDQLLVVLVSRLAFPLLEDGLNAPRVPGLRWADTALVLPHGLHGPFRDILTEREVDSRLSRVECAEALATFPAAVLLKESAAGRAG
ncbi:malto-oligosyltrehalose synthase [Xanthobacter sp. TB0139]|uniref:malto-oligosyltrehalose synthase n=1 Tax=Xanthobacter sp. TB0139 TaxID=3459178 RepID=UPI0040396415